MTIHRYTDWPHRHRRLLQAFLAVVALFLLGLWMHILPMWRDLQARQENLENGTAAWAKSSYPVDAQKLQEHLDECERQLKGNESSPGVIQLANATLERASVTFREDIRMAYPVVGVPAKNTSEQIFIANANRLDMKDLYDRVSTWFGAVGIHVNMTSLRLDENGSEPIYQQILKLWTIRNLVQLAYNHNLQLAIGRDGQHAAVSAMQSIAYVIADKDAKPYLLEFPVRMRLTGTMANFLAFVRELQTDDCFLPIKRLVIHSDPPKTPSPDAGASAETLDFMVVCSSFFNMPESK